MKQRSNVDNKHNPSATTGGKTGISPLRIPIFMEEEDDDLVLVPFMLFASSC
jgi:hypothetical protein